MRKFQKIIKTTFRSLFRRYLFYLTAYSEKLFGFTAFYTCNSRQTIISCIINVTQKTSRGSIFKTFSIIFIKITANVGLRCKFYGLNPFRTLKSSSNVDCKVFNTVSVDLRETILTTAV